MQSDAKAKTSNDGPPWSEPSWLTLPSPYYNDSHRKLRNALRAYYDENVKPNMLEWEEQGDVPEEVRLEHARSGIPFADVPEPYRQADVLGPGGILVKDLDVFHLLIMTDESCRIEGGVGTAMGGGSVIGVPPIVHYGTEEQKKKWLPGLFTWKTSFCLAITEPSGGVSTICHTLRTRLM